MKRNNPSSSWEKSAGWYDKAVGTEGHYYHTHIVLPGALRLLALDETSSLLDLACGQGVLERQIQKSISYLGIDASSSLIRAAQGKCKTKNHLFALGDITAPLTLAHKNFTHATLILALQNVEDPENVLRNAALHLKKGGKLLIVMNHPCFRIPRQTSWEIDKAKKIQYRRLDRYLTPLEIPIYTHPSQKEDSPATRSFHFPLSAYSTWLKNTGFNIQLMEEWISDKRSTGGAAAMENRSRKEFPLFLALLCQKQ